MKKYLLFIFLAILFLTNIVCAESIKPRIGILDFNAKNVSQVEAEAVGELFTSEMVMTNSFDIVDRQNIESLLTEMDFQLSGCTDSSCAVEVGQILSLEYMLYGSVIKLGNIFSINVQMINVATAQIVHTGSERFTSIEEAYDVVPRLAKAFSVGFGSGENVLAEGSAEDKNKLTKEQKVGIATFFSGVAVAGLSAWGWVVIDEYAYNLQEAHEDYLLSSFDNMNDTKEIYLEALRTKNTYLFLSLGGSILGVSAITLGSILWSFDLITFENNDNELSLSLLPSHEGVNLSFNYRGVNK